MRLGDEHPGSGEPSSVIGSQVGPFTLLHRLGEAMARRASAMPLDAVAHVITEVAAGIDTGHGAGTPAADVFALGVVAYQLTTGGWEPHPPGHPHGDVGAPIDPRERMPGLPAAW